MLARTWRASGGTSLKPQPLLLCELLTLFNVAHFSPCILFNVQWLDWGPTATDCNYPSYAAVAAPIDVAASVSWSKLRAYFSRMTHWAASVASRICGRNFVQIFCYAILFVQLYLIWAIIFPSTTASAPTAHVVGMVANKQSAHVNAHTIVVAPAKSPAGVLPPAPVQEADPLPVAARLTPIDNIFLGRGVTYPEVEATRRGAVHLLALLQQPIEFPFFWATLPPTIKCDVGGAVVPRSHVWLCNVGALRAVSAPACNIFVIGTMPPFNFERDAAENTPCLIHVYCPPDMDLPRIPRVTYHRKCVGHEMPGGAGSSSRRIPLLGEVGNVRADLMRIEAEHAAPVLLELAIALGRRDPKVQAFLPAQLSVALKGMKPNGGEGLQGALRAASSLGYAIVHTAIDATQTSHAQLVFLHVDQRTDL